jgi:hypothetical protein
MITETFISILQNGSKNTFARRASLDAGATRRKSLLRGITTL